MGDVYIEEIGEDGEPITALSMLEPALQKRVLYLKKLQDDYEEKEKDYEREFRALEKKYEAVYGQIFAKRAEVIKGTTEAPDDIKVEEKIKASPNTPTPNGIPKFWLQTLLESEIAEKVLDHDEPVLEYLVDIRCENIYPKNEEEEEEGFDGFILTFEFSENPFFTNKTLTKTYRTNNDGITGTDGCFIDWKTNKNVTIKVLKKKTGRGAAKKGGKVHQETKIEMLPSFFNFFAPMAIPESEAQNLSERDITEAISEDYEVGEVYRDEIIPRAVSYFLGEVEEEEDSDEDDDDEDDDSDDDDDDEDDDDDDEEDDDDDSSLEEVPLQAAKGRRRMPKNKAGGKDQPAECKQQ